MTDLDLSIVSDDEFNCYNNSEGRPISVNVDDDLQIQPKETRLSPDTGTNHDHIITKPTTPIRRSRRFAKQTEKLGGIPYQTNNNRKRKKITIFCYRKNGRHHHKTVKKRKSVTYGQKKKSTVLYGTNTPKPPNHKPT